MSANPAVPPAWDWQRPDYAPVIQARIERLARIRGNPAMLPALKVYYQGNPTAFINDWGMTLDPRNIERGLPAAIPFVLFPKQAEWVTWLLARWHGSEPGITEKTREMGMSWLTICTAATLCLFHKGMVIGFGSRKEEYVDSRSAPKALFEKARFFLSNLPPEFLGGWERDKHSPHMRILFPGTGSAMTGESGDGIGRGDRASIYFVDEAAFLERPQLVDASLSQTTNCRQDISTPNGMANSFAQRRHSGKIPVFTFHWRDDPRKNQAWYERQLDTLDAVTVAQELDINYSGSLEGVVIPSAWVAAAVDLHVRLGLNPTGLRTGALDVADRGADKNAFCVRHGFLLEHVQSWTGAGSDIFATTEKAFHLCDSFKLYEYLYDGDGLGAGVRGDARKINERRRAAKMKALSVIQFRGSGAVLYPERLVPQTERTNADFFANAKAQAWWSLRFRFQAAFRASQGLTVNPEDLISIASGFPERARLCIELSTPTYTLNGLGKILVDKQPDAVASPNLGDAAMMAFAPKRAMLQISPELLAATARR